MMTRKVGASEQKAVIKLTATYQQFCKQRQQLSNLDQQIQDRLNDYEKALIRETRKPRGLLAPKGPLSAKKRSALQTHRHRPN